MKRRDAVRMLPLSIAGLAGLAGRAYPSNPMAAGSLSVDGVPLSMQYVSRIIDMLTWIRENQSERLLEASYAIARAVENGNTCWQSGWDAGHTQADIWEGRNGLPDIFRTGYDREAARDGDVLLCSSGMGNEEFLAHLEQKDVFVVSRPSPWSGDAGLRDLVREDARSLTLKDHADIWIEDNNTTVGGIIDLPGMPAPLGPVSAVLGKVTIWMMIADACRILARRGLSVPVMGDEPPLPDTVDWRAFSGWVKLNDPLMDDYFTQVITELTMIRGELGKLQRMGELAVEAVKAGGTVYGYSRYTSIAGEANTRRAGLALTRGIYGSRGQKFTGREEDFVIMGITKPDDEVDLEYLDMFKKAGMRTASVGPMTRGIRMAEGRTVFRETDVHAGRMCDTYGLFAVPGFSQKICPTSGVLINQLYWAAMMEFAQQFIEGTGNVPAVYYSGALKGGMEHYFRMQEISNEEKW